MPRAPAERRRLTKEAVARTKSRPSKFIVWDTEVPNLGLRVYPSGAKSYVLRLTFTNADGKTMQRMETVGDAASYSDPEAARKDALGLRQRYKAGEDVRASEQAKKTRETTLRQSLDLYLAARATGRKPMKASTAKDMRRQMSYGLAELMDKPIAGLDAETIIQWHRGRKAVAPVRSDGEARYLRAVWNWTREELPDLELPEWPTRRWSRQKEWSPPQPRTTRLRHDTAPVWMQATQSWTNERDRTLFLLLFYTGWRIGEAMNLRWADVDLDKATAILRDTKTRANLTLPLARQAVEALSPLPQHTDWVFPAPLKTGGVGPMVIPSKALVRHRAESGVKWSAHDLRRTFISVGESIGVPTAAVRRLTGHVVKRSDAHDGYIDFDPHELAPHGQRIADALEAMASGRRRIVNLHTARSIA